MLVKAVSCEECKTTIYSRGSEDLRECDCGRIVVYGGFLNHFKYEVKDKLTKYKIIKININATPADLYKDFESMDDNYGLVRTHLEESSEPKRFIF
jgi:hypothetical protein